MHNWLISLWQIVTFFYLVLLIIVGIIGWLMIGYFFYWVVAHHGELELILQCST